MEIKASREHGTPKERAGGQRMLRENERKMKEEIPNFNFT